MKITFDRFILILLLLLQSASVSKSQLLNGISHVLEDITEQKPPTSSHQSPSSTNSPAHQQPSATLQPSSSPSPQASSSTPSSTQAPPPPPPTQSSSEKPSTSQKLPDTTTKHQTPPSNDAPSTPSSPSPVTNNSPQTQNNSPTTLDVQNTPTKIEHPVTSSESTTSNDDHTISPQNPSTMPSESGKSKTNKSTKTPTNNSSPEDTIKPSTAINQTNRSVSNVNNDNNNATENKSGAIVGAIVGTISGIALIAGLLTWGVRKRKHNKRSTDFEDFGLADTDFPNKSPGMRTTDLATNTAILGPISQAPYTNTQYYQPQLDSGHLNYSQSVVDYSQQPQSLYYPPQDGTMGGFNAQGYNTGYFYEDTLQQTSQATDHNYDINTQYPAVNGDQFYKPDQVDLRHHQRNI